MSTKVNPDRPVRAAQQQGEKVAHSWTFDWLARSGFVARGVIYGIIGVLAVKLALGDGDGKATNQQGALRTIAHQPFGRTLLTIVAIGLGGYALWRLIRAAGMGRSRTSSPLGSSRRSRARRPGTRAIPSRTPSPSRQPLSVCRAQESPAKPRGA